MKTHTHLPVFLLILIAFTMTVTSEAGEKNAKKILTRPSVFTNRGKPAGDLSPTKIKSLADPGAPSISSTILFEEDFESASGFPPAGWKTVNADGGGSTGPWFAGNISVFSAQSGDEYAAANYQGANENYIDEWLISPAISSLTSADTLLFWQRSPDDSPWYDSIDVRISYTDTAISSFTTRIDYFKTSTGGWVQKHYPLGGYIGSGNPVYIAFRYLIYNGGPSGMNSDYTGIDLIQIVRPRVASDIRALSIDNPEDGAKMVVNQPLSPVATFQNAGSVAKSAIPVRLRIKSPTGSIYEDNQAIAYLAPGSTSQITFKNYTPAVTGVYTVKVFVYLPGDQNPGNDSLGIITRGSVLLSGTFTVGVGGDIKSIGGAADTLNHNIVSGDINFSLVDRVYSEQPILIEPPDYQFSAQRITLKPASGVSPTITIQAAAARQFGFYLAGAPFITINGSNSTQNSRNTFIRVMGEYGKAGILIGGNDQAFADSNVIKNLMIGTGADTTSDAGDYFGIMLLGFSSDLKDYGNIISNCEIIKQGGAGIAVQWHEGAVIENNYIHGWEQDIGENNVTGILNADGSCKSVIRGNVVGDLKTANNNAWAIGIENSAGEGSNVLIYNNIVYNILSYGSGSGANRSIGIFGSSYFNSGDSYCYNSIYLSGTDLSSSAQSRTAGIELTGGSNITIVNNIIYNESALSGSAEENRAYGIYLSGLQSNFNSNHNIFYNPLAQGVIGYNDGVWQALTQWRSSFVPPQDGASIAGDPLYISKISGNLHVNPAGGSPANGTGIPVSGITKDIDGHPRSLSAPDIGADEFIPGGISVQQVYSAGWNLVSVPLTVENYQSSALFPESVSDAFSYRGSYTAEEIMQNGLAYWIKFNSLTINNFVGLPRPADTISVMRGWNMIGTISDTVSIFDIVQVPSGIIISDYYLHNNGYIAVDMLLPGKGYWVKVSQDGDLILR